MSKAIPELKELLVHKEPKAFKEQQVPKELKAIQAWLAQLDLPGILVLQGLLAQQGLKVLQESRSASTGTQGQLTDQVTGQ